jgi:hypothetical protein
VECSSEYFLGARHTRRVCAGYTLEVVTLAKTLPLLEDVATLGSQGHKQHAGAVASFVSPARFNLSQWIRAQEGRCSRCRRVKKWRNCGNLS